MSNIQYVQSVLSNAPMFVAINPELSGWFITEDGITEFCCARCAARIMARGCWVFSKSAKPVWTDSIKPDLPCIGCEVKVEQEIEEYEED